MWLKQAPGSALGSSTFIMWHALAHKTNINHCKRSSYKRVNTFYWAPQTPQIDFLLSKCNPFGLSREEPQDYFILSPFMCAGCWEVRVCMLCVPKNANIMPARYQRININKLYGSLGKIFRTYCRSIAAHIASVDIILS